MRKGAFSTGSLLVAALLGGVPFAFSCAPRDQEAAAAARAAEWATIERERAALDGLRAELAAAREQDASATPELETRVGHSTDRFLERLVAFINQHAGAREPNGTAKAAPELAAAIRMKSSEDLLLAREYIERGGDYAKAIDILASAEVVDPDNSELVAARAEAERLRYMDQERFARVEKGMTEDDVRAELGQVKQQNVREETGQVVWLYPRENGAAAAVFFRAGREGVLAVDDTNFEAVPSPTDGPPG
ncbi:MAG TPA: hypothetical protein VHR17_10180 [Thermoanaerobaculia bacterium]|jgi:hypothetical protein|nr:hypothetical protein [Thermoanaerobaculia bacterium]